MRPGLRNNEFTYHGLAQKMFKYLTEIPNFTAVRKCYILIKDSLPHFGTLSKLGSPMPFLARVKQCLDTRLNMKLKMLTD